MRNSLRRNLFAVSNTYDEKIPPHYVRHYSRSHLWDAQSGKPLKVLNEDDNSTEIDEIAFSPDSSLLVTGHSDGAVKIWHIPNR